MSIGPEMQQRCHCRVCGHGVLDCLLHFPDYPQADNFLASADDPRQWLADYRLHRCTDCGLVQNLTDLDWGSYYQDYVYTSANSPLSLRYMADLAVTLVDRYGLESGDRVIEIGSGDGAQLSCFTRAGMQVLGFEPSRMLADAAEAAGVSTLRVLFDRVGVERIPASMLPAQLVLSCYTLDHMSDPLEMLRMMAGLLDPDRGLLMLEVHDLAQIVARCEACLFCHEHTVYLDVAAMARLLEQAGLVLVTWRVQSADCRRGNSLQVIAALPGSCWVWHRLDVQSSSATDLSGLADRIHCSHVRFAETVAHWTDGGLSVGGYGASARSIATLALAGLGHDRIRYIADANTALQGLWLPRSGVPIISPVQVHMDPVDRLIVFAYGYMSEIVDNMQPLLDRGMQVCSMLDLLQENGS